MNAQTWIVAGIVLVCTLHVAWRLMPAGGRRAIAQGLLRWPLPSIAADKLRKTATATSGCGCSGCDRPRSAAKPSQTVIRLYRKPE